MKVPKLNILMALLFSPAETRSKLKRAREAAKKHPNELGRFVYNSTSAYYDLENVDDEIYSNISIGNLAELCSFLGISARSLFTDSQNEANRVAMTELAE